MTETADILFYCQHLLGIGHLRRAALIATAVDRAGMKTVFASGGMPVTGLDIGGARLVQLPPLRTADAVFSALVDEAGRPIDEAWRQARRDALLELFDRTAPRLLLIEMFPFGRRQLRFELLPLLEAARARKPRPLVVCSVRDVLNPQSNAEKTAWILDTVTRYFDRVLVHGDPGFLTLEHSFPEAAVATPPPARVGPGEGSGEVLVSTGGGAVAEPLIAAALAARPRSPLADAPWRILAGPNLPEAVFDRFRAMAPSGVVVERARPDFTTLLARCRLSISQAGYNTVMELLAAGPPAVVVPFAAGQEREQTLRAELLARRGLLTVVEEAGLDGERLARAIARALEPAPNAGASLTLKLDGADTTARKLRQLLGIVET
jgi:predicted glycosyltransferase